MCPRDFGLASILLGSSQSTKPFDHCGKADTMVVRRSDLSLLLEGETVLALTAKSYPYLNLGCGGRFDERWTNIDF